MRVLELENPHSNSPVSLHSCSAELCLIFFVSSIVIIYPAASAASKAFSLTRAFKCDCMILPNVYVRA